MKTSEIASPSASTQAAWQGLLSALPVADLEASARACRVLQRTRQITSAFDLLRLIFVVSVGGASLRLAAGWAMAALRRQVVGQLLWAGVTIDAITRHLPELARHLRDSPRQRPHQAAQAQRLLCDLQLLR